MRGLGELEDRAAEAVLGFTWTHEPLLLDRSEEGCRARLGGVERRELGVGGRRRIANGRIHGAASSGGRP
jgi:hypothetical protein